MMEVKIGRVLSARARKPSVVAAVDCFRVQWNPRPGWRCDCTGRLVNVECEHIAALLAVLDARTFDPRPLAPREATS